MEMVNITVPIFFYIDEIWKLEQLWPKNLDFD